MLYFMSLAVALAVSMGLIPLAIRLAPVLGLVDVPDARKVHAKPMPRVGGIGLVLGALVALFLFLPAEPLYRSYILGGLVLFGFGLLDDRLELGHYTKFVGQFIAVGLVVFYGGLTIERFPLISPEPIHHSFGQALTFFALIGMINAANHSDGLDGLAGGLTLMTLLALGALAYQANGTPEVVIALAVTGGILGFLRYNTHPAAVFMGDSGSQFLGFTSGFLVILLTQRVNPALSPALPAFLLGLPVADSLAVFYQRIAGGMNWFRATRNHIHHRLLDIGFAHQSAVVVIYALQLVFVSCAMALQYQSDMVILTLYFTAVAVLFGTLVVFERGTVARGVPAVVARVSGVIETALNFNLLWRGSLLFLGVVTPLYFVMAAFTAREVTWDFGIVSILLLAVLTINLFFNHLLGSVSSRITIYAVVVFAVFLLATSPPAFIAEAELVQKVFFAAVAGAIALCLRLAPDVKFRTTALDYLIAFLVIFVALSPMPEVLGEKFAAITVKCAILLYACEVLLSCRTRVPTPLYVGSLVSLAVLSIRGLL